MIDHSHDLEDTGRPKTDQAGPSCGVAGDRVEDDHGQRQREEAGGTDAEDRASVTSSA